MRCFDCKGPWHPATGFVMGPQDTTICGTCHRRFVTWLRRHTARKWGGGFFYEHAWSPA
jgi:hypothetical protein